MLRGGSVRMKGYRPNNWIILHREIRYELASPGEPVQTDVLRWRGECRRVQSSRAGFECKGYRDVFQIRGIGGTLNNIGLGEQVLTVREQRSRRHVMAAPRAAWESVHRKTDMP